jgi:hypothetical protein
MGNIQIVNFNCGGRCMDKISLRIIQEKFHAYVKTLHNDESFLRDNIILKEDHSQRVCVLSEKLSHALHLSEEETSLAMVVGILHDIGRFPQFAHYRTFRDNLSINHADLGYTVLSETDILQDTTRADKAIILTAVRNHNLKEIEENLDERSLMHVKIIRDCDKLDIIPLMIEYYETRHHSPKPGLELSFPDTPGFTDEIISHILRCEPVPNSIRRNYNDLKLTQLSWLLDLNFAWSYQYTLEHRFAEKLREYLPDERRIDAAVNHIVSIMKSRAK